MSFHPLRAFHPLRFLALAVKEFQQLKKNRRLVVQLVVPPTLALVLLGFALNPEVTNLRTGVVDYSRTPLSRELVDHLTRNSAFLVTSHFLSAAMAEEALRQLKLDVVIVVPADLARTVAQGGTARVQVWTDAVNANGAGIAQNYLAQAAMSFNQRVALGFTSPPAGLRAKSAVLYNPGMTASWFFVTGLMSVIIFINGALVASALTVREKELGTIEQLLMSPAQTLEVLFAKTVPVVLMMLVVLTAAVLVSMVVFDLPQRGSWLLLLLAGALAAVSGTGIGITMATFCTTQQQAQLLTFFLIPPLVMVSGAFSPVETMPWILQKLSLLDPVRYMAILVRGVTMKGAGLALLWQPLLTLASIAAVLYGISAWRFRGQLH